jgi:hypothetical protein
MSGVVLSFSTSTPSMRASRKPLLAGHLEVVARAGQVNGIAVDIPGHAVQLLALEIAPRVGIGEGQPAGGVDVGRFEDGVDLVLALQALGDHFELQRCRRRRAAARRCRGSRRPGSRPLRRAPAGPFCNCLLFSGSRSRASAEELRREVGDALEASASPSLRQSPMCRLPWLWMPMMSPATASSISRRSLAMKVSTLASFISRSRRRCLTFMPGV